MKDTSAGVSPIASKPAFLSAAIRWQNGVRVVVVYRSVLVRDTDPCMEPVFGILQGVCFLPGTPQTVDDDEMMFGKASHVEHALFQGCPGNNVEHTCNASQKGMAA